MNPNSQQMADYLLQLSQQVRSGELVVEYVTTHFDRESVLVDSDYLSLFGGDNHPSEIKTVTGFQELFSFKKV